MTLTATFLASNPAPPSDPTPDQNEKKVNKNMIQLIQQFLLIFMILLILDIILIYFTIKSILLCQRAGKWNTLVSILLILVCLFVPGIGFILSIFLIIYAKMTCGSEKTLSPNPVNAFKFKI